MWWLLTSFMENPLSVINLIDLSLLG
ncbi:hypothetical protein Golax_021946 [Gossypium laxum]|uniref:Uncharacterized protein n=1 Tax=Gossypium laxum TaxID=34288 RepID=A0A7J9AMM9_9ROSI|nr:hypothetical protein [Gossypium laxum]